MLWRSTRLTINQSFLVLLSFISLRQREIVMTDITTRSLLSDKMVDMAFITEFTGCSDKWFYKLIQEGLFPKPIKLGRSSRWLKSEVEEWVQKRIAESRA
ncbi:putative phage protein [Yersinia enterocolitica (type O:5) str. YE53/03]|nr:putative phage protein [Yersinia enterocolitica (type O:5) str. YE53/03]